MKICRGYCAQGDLPCPDEAKCQGGWKDVALAIALGVAIASVLFLGWAGGFR